MGGYVRVPDRVYQSRYLTKAYRFVVSGAWYPGHLMTRFFEKGDEPAKVFKAMYNHVNNPWTLRYLLGHKEIRVLHLRRQNVLKQYVSRLLLSHRRVKKWQPHAVEPVPAVSVVVSPPAALDYMRRTRALYDHYEHVFAGHAKLPLVYEDMIEGQSLRRSVAREICEFLGISTLVLGSQLIKINPNNLRQMVTNYDELAAVVRTSEFANLLD